MPSILEKLPGEIFKKHYTALLSLICIVFLAVGILSVRDDAVTIDEVAHIVSGYSMVTTLGTTLNIEHPPLIKIIAGFPLIFQDITFKLPAHQIPNQWVEGHNLLFASRNNTDDILFWSRAAVVMFHTFLLYLCGICLRKFLAPGFSLAALVFLAFEPNIFAHARYVTTDTGIALFSVLALLLTAQLLISPSRKYALLLGVSMGGALLTKFSAVLLVLYITLALLAGSIFLYRTEKEQLKSLFRYWLAALGTAFFLVYTMYTFLNISTPPSQIKTYVASSFVPASIKQMENALADSVFTRAVPAYISGFDYASNRSIQKSEETGAQFLDRTIKFNGEGWWYYFLKAFLYKESPAILLLTGIAFTVLVWMLVKRKKLTLEISVLAGFSLLYLLLSLTSTLNIGIRHISPVLALTPLIGIFILAGWEWKYKNILLAFLIATQILTIVSVYPFYLSYFNDLSGGSLYGSRHLSDSNVDWGQNIKRLAKWSEEKGFDTVYVDYWGKTPLSFYDRKGILKPWNGDQGKPQGIFAVYSVWIEQSIWMKNQGIVQNDYSYLEKLPMLDQIGNSIYIYDLR